MLLKSLSTRSLDHTSSGFGGMWDEFVSWVSSWFDEKVYYPIVRIWSEEEKEEEEYVHQAKTFEEIVNETIQQQAWSSNIQPALIHAIIRVESEYDPGAHSSTGAIGLMQILPSTGKLLGYTASSLWDPVTNIEAGIKLLKHLMGRYNNIWDAVAAYQHGKAVKDRSGKYINQWYVNKVYEEYKNI